MIPGLAVDASPGWASLAKMIDGGVVCVRYATKHERWRSRGRIGTASNPKYKRHDFWAYGGDVVWIIT